MSGQLYAAAQQVGKQVLTDLPGPVLELARTLEEHAKGMVVPATLFEEFGFNYIGPIDGHDLESLIPTLQNIKQLQGPQFLHVVTEKGQGYKLAEADPVLYHGTTQVRSVGRHPEVLQRPARPPTPQVFGDWLCDVAAPTRAWSASRRRCAKVRAGALRAAVPDRYFDVGIAEQHAVTFAAGLARDGIKPVVAIYSTFLQRAYDQLIHDVALQNLDVTVRDRPRRPGRRRRRHAPRGNFDLSLPAAASRTWW